MKLCKAPMSQASAEPLRVGLVGCSWFALRAHIPALLALEQGGCRGFAVRIEAVCSRTRKSMAKAEAKIGRSVVRHAQMQALIDDPKIDVVLIVLPIPLAAAAVEAALRAGKHVISEKPAAFSLERTVALLALHRSLPAPAPLWAVSENWAHKPSVVWMRQRLDEGCIGRVLAAHACHHELVGPRGWPEGWRGAGEHEGGWLLDIGVHWLRMLRVLLGEASRVSASAARLAPHLPPYPQAG